MLANLTKLSMANLLACQNVLKYFVTVLYFVCSSCPIQLKFWVYFVPHMPACYNIDLVKFAILIMTLIKAIVYCQLANQSNVANQLIRIILSAYSL